MLRVAHNYFSTKTSSCVYSFVFTSWAQKQKRYFKGSFSIDKNGNVSLKHMHGVLKRLDNERTFNPYDVKAVKIR